MKSIRKSEGLRKPIPPRGEIREVLLLDFFLGFGDSLYINGLVLFLIKRGLRVHIAASPKVASVFQTTLPTESIHDITNLGECEKLASYAWDAVVDLTYTVKRFQRNFRVRFLSQTISPVLGMDLNIRFCPEVCSEWLDVRERSHFGEFWAAVAERITGDTVKRISPYTGIKPLDLKETFIYVNCVGTRISRTLSQEQIDWIADFFTRKETSAYVYCSDTQSVKTSKYVKRICPKNFTEACRLIGATAGVISPDTAIVHVASAYQIPILAFFAGNIVEVSGHPVEKVFEPMGDYEIVFPDTTNRLSKEVVSVATIGRQEFEASLVRFLSRVNRHNAKGEFSFD